MKTESTWEGLWPHQPFMMQCRCEAFGARIKTHVKQVTPSHWRWYKSIIAVWPASGIPLTQTQQSLMHTALFALTSYWSCSIKNWLSSPSGKLLLVPGHRALQGFRTCEAWGDSEFPIHHVVLISEKGERRQSYHPDPSLLPFSAGPAWSLPHPSRPLCFLVLLWASLPQNMSVLETRVPHLWAHRLGLRVKQRRKGGGVQTGAGGGWLVEGKSQSCRGSQRKEGES